MYLICMDVDHCCKLKDDTLSVKCPWAVWLSKNQSLHALQYAYVKGTSSRLASKALAFFVERRRVSEFKIIALMQQHWCRCYLSEFLRTLCPDQWLQGLFARGQLCQYLELCVRILMRLSNPPIDSKFPLHNACDCVGKRSTNLSISIQTSIVVNSAVG